MNKNKHRNVYAWLYRILYIGGFLFLISGMVLSLVQTPVQAASNRSSGPSIVQVTETAGPEPTETTVVEPTETTVVDPTETTVVEPTEEPSATDVPTGTSEPTADLPTVTSTLPPTAVYTSTPIQSPVLTGSVHFNVNDTPICQPQPGTIEATVTVSLTPGAVAILQTSWQVIEPQDLATNPIFERHLVSDGDTVTIVALWPGIRPGDPVVEIHMGAMLLNPYTGDPISDGASVDFYWYPWYCSIPTATPVGEVTEIPTATFTPTPTLIVSNPTDTPTPTPTLLVVEDTDTPTPTPTLLVNSPTDTPTPTPTMLVVGDTDTPTPTPTLLVSIPTDTPTPTPTLLVVDDTDTPTPTPTILVGGSTPTTTPVFINETVVVSVTPSVTPPPTLTPEFPIVGNGTLTSTPVVPVTGEQAGGGNPFAVLQEEVTPTAVFTVVAPPPVALEDQALVPVTGADLEAQPIALLWNKLFTYAGLFSLGLAMLLQGLERKQ